MRQPPEFFGDHDLALVYIAKKLREAQALESLLSAKHIDYLVEPDTYMGGFLFFKQRTGAFFYVDPSQEESVRELLLANRYQPYQPTFET